MVVTVYQHGRMALAALKKFAVSQTKDAERRDKLSIQTGKDTESGQDS